MIVQMVLGAVMLLFGRKLFWLFVGAAGFLAGSRFGAMALAGHSYWLTIGVAAATGIAGVLIALLFQRAAFALGGFFAGAYLVGDIMLQAGIPAPSPIWILAGGVAGAILAAVIMDWAIIWLSCLVGAGAVAWAIGRPSVLTWVVWAALIFIGYFFQARSLRGSASRSVHR